MPRYADYARYIALLRRERSGEREAQHMLLFIKRGAVACYAADTRESMMARCYALTLRFIDTCHV